MNVHDERDIKICALGMPGVLLGGIAGFALRPAVPLLGQLPLWAVIAGGSGLEGMSEMFRPLAAYSLALLAIGAIAGGIAGVVLGLLTIRTRQKSNRSSSLEEEEANERGTAF